MMKSKTISLFVLLGLFALLLSACAPATPNVAALSDGFNLESVPKYLMDMARKQAMFRAWEDTLWICILTIISGMASYLYLHWKNSFKHSTNRIVWSHGKEEVVGTRIQDDWDWDDPTQFMCTALLIGWIIIAASIIISNVTNILIYLINPDYAALYQLTKLLPH